jgi:hypothetical protein
MKGWRLRLGDMSNLLINVARRLHDASQLTLLNVQQLVP